MSACKSNNIPAITQDGDRICVFFDERQIPTALDVVARQEVVIPATHKLHNCIALPDGRVRLDYDPST